MIPESIKMITQAVPTGDDELDERAWKKTQDEIDGGIASKIDSWECLVEQVGHDVVVAVRRAIWERHGNA